MGFGVSIDAWLRGPLKEWAESLLDEKRLLAQGIFNSDPIRQQWSEHLSETFDWKSQIWLVLMFQGWLDHAEQDLSYFGYEKSNVFIGSRHMLPTAKELLLSGNLGLTENTATRDLLEEKFFYSIVLSNGTHKRTWAGRLDEVDQTLIATFHRLGVAPKTFLDVAVSSGVSTVMWLDSLRQAGLQPSMTATDLTMTAYLVRLNSWLHVLVDKEGFPLQYDVFGFAWRPRCRIRYYVLGNGVLTVLWHLLYRKVAKRFSLITRLKSLGTNPPTTDDPLIKAQIKLVTHRLRDNRDIELLDDDITVATPTYLKRRFEVIRAANILNRNYFPVQQLRAAVRNLRDRLIGAGASLLIVRTDETGSNHGSIFCLDVNGSFGVVERVGRGSEIEDIVLSI